MTLGGNTYMGTDVPGIQQPSLLELVVSVNHFGMVRLGQVFTGRLSGFRFYSEITVKPGFDELLCYGASSTAFRRKHSDASVSTKALLMSAMLMTESWATAVRSCPWPQCDSASG